MRLSRLLSSLIALLLILLTVSPVRTDQAGTRPQTPLRAQTMALLEDIEQTRLLLGAAMWQTHDLHNFGLYCNWKDTSLESFDREHLRLYEALKPLDYGASSLLMAIDLGDDRTAAEDLAFLRGELGPLAAQVLAQFRKVDEAHRLAKAGLLDQAMKDGLRIETLPGKAWDDPVRERQRKLGVQIGWRTNMEPPPGFRENDWNDLQHLDIRYQLDKGRRMGITFLVFKDPVLRWDMVEPRKGQYDFRAFDRMMDLAIGKGYNVKLIIPAMGGRVPDWWTAERPESLIRNEKGEGEYAINPGAYAHDFMGPIKREGPWYQSRPANLSDEPTRAQYARYIKAVADHCRQKGYLDHVLTVSSDLFHADRHWQVPPGADKRAFILDYYRRLTDILRPAFTPVPLDIEVSDGEAHNTNYDYSAHEWRSAGLADLVDIPAVDSETPLFEDLMRAVSLQAATIKDGKVPEAGPFFYQNCEYGFGTMLSINYFTALLRDGLWSDGWFGPEGPLRWGYFPQIFAYNDRQMQWSGITNAYLAHRQAQTLGPTLANTRVTPADVILVLPSTSMDKEGYNVHRELIGWGWALTALKIQYDIITETELARGVPARAKLLILPQAVVLSAAQAANVRAFVEQGGLLFSSLVPATDGSAPSPLADILGCDLVTENGKPLAVMQTGVKGTWLQVTVPRGLHSGRYAPILPIDTGYPRKFGMGRGDNAGRGVEQPFQALQLKGGTQIAEYGTGQPAIVMNAYGKGKALTSGYPYGQELFFADWTSMAFGKIYNGWARDEQMLGMIRWLRDAIEQLGYARTTTAPEGWRYRLQGFEAAVSGLSYPKGPAITGDNTWAVTYSYLDARSEHRIKQDHDELDYAMELTWRDRPGVTTRYLAVGNRESAYAGERGAVQFWTMPHVVHIHIANPAIKRVYDIAAGVPVPVQRDKDGVSFRTSVPPAEGRIFAVSTDDTIELFETGKFTGASFEEVETRVSLLATKSRQRPTGVLDAQGIMEWLRAKQGGKVTIAYGDDEYRKAAETTAKWLKDGFGIIAEITAADGKFELQKDQFSVGFIPSPAEILIGNAWTNNTIACLDSTWPYNNPAAQATASGRLTATYAWPGGSRGFACLTRELDLRQENGTSFGQSYGNTDGFGPRGVNSAKEPYQRQRLLLLASTPAGALNIARTLAGVKEAEPTLQAYERPQELDPLPDDAASLYRTPWRANPRTASAYEALQGVGMYYKHMPVEWTLEENINVCKQLAAAGVKRMRLAPHHGIYINKDWQAPSERELSVLRKELRACKAAGIRPCVTFVHIPPVGKPGTNELQEWWRHQSELMPVGEVGSSEFKAYLDKTYLALSFILREAKDAGFTEPGSYDLEMGQNLWWGAPSVPRPFPSTGLEALRPGGRIYEFDRALIQRTRAEGYSEPSFWWSEAYHLFDQFRDDEVPSEAAGRAISFYSSWTGITTNGWLTNTQYDKLPGVVDTWPVRPPLKFIDGPAPELVLARPEGWMADCTRHDNMIQAIKGSKTPIGVASLGTVPSSIPDALAGGLNGWEMKRRGLTRSLAFWLNQGSPFVLLHSAFEPGSEAGGEMNHALIPNWIDPTKFTWKDADPLVTLRAFCDGLAGAKPLDQTTNLIFNYAVSPDPVLIPASGKAGPLKASDAVTLLPFQLDVKRFAVAAYVMTPNIARYMEPVRLTLRISERVNYDGITTLRPYNGAKGTALIVNRGPSSTTASIDLHDDVTWLIFTAE